MAHRPRPGGRRPSLLGRAAARGSLIDRPSDRPEEAGFVLLISLGLMAFVLFLMLSITLLARVEIANSATALQRLAAKENARLGLMVALGELQRYAGPDQRVTARADSAPSGATPFAGAEMWTGIWDASTGTPGNPIWLVSGDQPDPVDGPGGDSQATLFPEADTINPVRAAFVPTHTTPTGQAEFAYWVEDQSVKARINRRDRAESMQFIRGRQSLELRQDLRESLLGFPAQDAVFKPLRDSIGANTALPAEQVDSFARALSTPQLELAFPGGIDAGPLLTDRRHDFTAYSAGVMENPIDGGLKTNLTGINQEQLDRLLDEAENEDDHYLRGDFLLHYDIDPATGIPFPRTANANRDNTNSGAITANGEFVRVPIADLEDFRTNQTDPEDGDLQVVRNIMPIVTEASFRLGAFHTQTPNSNWHRVRFHADVEFWNPYPFPIRFPGEGQDRTFVVMLVPSQFGSGRGRSETEKMILSIEKLGRGRGGSEELHTNLLDFDETLFDASGPARNPTNNSANETVMNSWMIIDNVVLQPGEVYHATTGLGRGLARDLGGYVFGGGDPTDPSDYEPDPSRDLNRWSWHTFTNENEYPELAPSDRIRMNLRMPENGLTFRLIQWNPSSRSVNPVYEENRRLDWSKPVFELRNIYAIDNPPALTLLGSEYSRASSSSYTQDNFNIGFHFRLSDELIVGSDPSALAVVAGFDLRQPVWDYDNPAVKRALMIGGVSPEEAEAGVEPNPFDAPFREDIFFNGVDLFADNVPDRHSGGFSRAFLYTSPPLVEPVSVGSFRSLPLTPETAEFDANGDGEDDIVQLSVGAPWGGDLNEAFDKYFFTGFPQSAVADWAPGQPFPLPAEVRRDATAAELRQPEAATELLVEGSFNVNSTSARAWAAMLSRTIYSWSFSGNPSDRGDLKNAVLNLGSSTDAAINAIGGPSDESSLTTIDPTDLSSAESAGRLAMQHPLRRLTDAQIYNPDTANDDSLVEFLLDEIETYRGSNPPFASVSEFVNSGVLSRAIRRSDINGSIADFAPAAITQAALLEPIAPFLTVRADTFVVRSVGVEKNPSTGRILSRIMCEAVVQRLPERMDGDESRIGEDATSNGNALGRRFVIRSLNWGVDDS